jgi:hypothetical protein
LDKRLDGAQGRSGRSGEEKYLLPLPEIESQFVRLRPYPAAIPGEEKKFTSVTINKVRGETGTWLFRVDSGKRPYEETESGKHRNFKCRVSHKSGTVGSRIFKREFSLYAVR